MCIDIWQEESVRCVCGWVRDQKANTMDLESCRLGFFFGKDFFFFWNIWWIWIGSMKNGWYKLRATATHFNMIEMGNAILIVSELYLQWKCIIMFFHTNPFPPITLKCCQIKCDSLYQKQFTLQNKSLETFETFSDSFIWFSKVYQINRRLVLHVDGCQQQFWHGNFTFKPTGRLEWFDIWAMFISDLFSNLMLKMENWIYWLRKVK